MQRDGVAVWGVSTRCDDMEQSISSATLNAAREVVEFRRRRNQRFAQEGVFEDPAWDILLAIFVDEGVGKQVPVSSACHASNVAVTTALRYINRLVEVGLIERQDDAVDKRRTLLKLTVTGHRKMCELLGG